MVVSSVRAEKTQFPCGPTMHTASSSVYHKLRSGSLKAYHFAERNYLGAVMCQKDAERAGRGCSCRRDNRCVSNGRESDGGSGIGDGRGDRSGLRGRRGGFMRGGRVRECESMRSGIRCQVFPCMDATLGFPNCFQGPQPICTRTASDTTWAGLGSCAPRPTRASAGAQRRWGGNGRKNCGGSRDGCGSSRGNSAPIHSVSAQFRC